MSEESSKVARNLSRGQSGRLFNAGPALLMVLLSGPGYGFQLSKLLQERTKGLATGNDGSIYPALRKMERQGLVESFEGEPVPERGGKPRIYYNLTSAGREQAKYYLDALSFCAQAMSTASAVPVPVAKKAGASETRWVEGVEMLPSSA